MADKRLDKDQIAPKDVMDNIGDSAVKQEKKVKALNSTMEILVKTARELNELLKKQSVGGAGGGRKPNTKDLAEFNRLTKEANITATTKLGIDKQLLVEKEKLRQATQSQNKAIKEEVALAKSQKGSLERLRLESKKLRNEKEKLNLNTKEGNRRLKIINRTLDRNNAILEKNATKLGKQKIAIGKYSKALGGLRRALGQLGLAFGVFALIKDSFNIIADFQQAQANLASVLGVNVKEMKALTAQAKELGSTTRFTAGEVSNLQTELAKLGFSQAQIGDMTAATLSLAEATGVELATAAEVAGSTLNAFGLEAKDTQRVVDTMAKAFSTSSLDMEKFKVAMASVAPIAKTMGFSIEETTAMLGVLTDSGLDASTAGTSLRNMMLEAEKQGLTWKEALDKVSKSQNKASTALELFGKRGTAAGVILADNQKAIESQTKVLDENTKASLRGESAAAIMADTQRNTLAGALDLLKSAWEGLVLSMDEAGGVGETIRKGIVFLSKNLGTILKVLGKVIKLFIIYKTTLAALKLKDKIREQIEYNASLKTTGEGAKKASAGVKAFGQALSSIAIAAAIALVVELAQAFHAAATGANDLADAQKRLESINKASTKRATERVEGRTNALEKELKMLDRLAEKDKRRAKTDEDRLRIDKELLTAREALITSRKKAIQTDIEEVIKQKKGFEADREELKIIKLRIEAGTPLNKQMAETAIRLGVVKRSATGMLENILGATGGVNSLQQASNKLNAQISGSVTKIIIYNAEMEETKGVLGDVTHEQELLGIELPKTAGGIKKLNTQLGEQNELLSRQVELLHELDQIKIRSQVEDVQGKIDEALANEAKRARETGELDVDLVEELIFKKAELLKQAALDRQEFEIATIIETNRIEGDEVLKKITDNRDKLLAQQGLTTDQRADIEAQYQAQLEQFEMDQLQRAGDLELEILIIKGNTSEELIEITKATNDEINDANDELTDALIEGIDKVDEKRDTSLADEEKRQKAFRDMMEKFGNQVLQGQIDRSKEKQALLDKEISKQQELADRLRDGAETQNAVASESLALLESSIEEKERAKIKEAQKEANLERIKAVWNGLNNFMDQGDTFPIATIKSFAAVSTVENLIGKFFKGTKGRLGDEDKAVHGGQDGHLIWADSSEMIFNGGQVDQAEASGMNTTDDIIKSAVMYHQLKGITAENNTYNMTVDTTALEAKVDKLTNIMKNKKETSFHPHLINGMLEGIERREKTGSFTNSFIKLKGQ